MVDVSVFEDHLELIGQDNLELCNFYSFASRILFGWENLSWSDGNSHENVSDFAVFIWSNFL